MTRHYTKSPEPSAEDFQLPWFLKDDEKYVELMAAVATILDAYPVDVEAKHWARLNEAYSQVVRGPHSYVGFTQYNITPTTRANLALVPGHCLWCDKDAISHR